MASLAEVIKGAMSLDIRDRAVLAEKLLASLDELSPTALTPRSGPQQCVCISIRGAIQSDRTRNLRREANR